MNDIDRRLTECLANLGHAITERYGDIDVQEMELQLIDASCVDRKQYVVSLTVRHSQRTDTW